MTKELWIALHAEHGLIPREVAEYLWGAVEWIGADPTQATVEQIQRACQFQRAIDRAAP